MVAYVVVGFPAMIIIGSFGKPSPYAFPFVSDLLR